MFRKRSHVDDDEHILKAATAKVSQVVVSIVSHNLPVELCENFRGFTRMAGPPAKKAWFYGCGIILESHISANNDDDDDTCYLSTILAPACLFSHIPRDKIDIDVYVLTGVLYKAKLLACDFHYNLALITINSDSPLPTAVLTGIDDVLSIDPTYQPMKKKNKKKKSFGLRPRSHLFKVAPKTKIFSVCRSYVDPLLLFPSSGTLCLRSPEGFSCNELFEIKDDSAPGLDGAPVLNSFGQVIGILFDTTSLLPSNIVLRWWNHYKSFGRFCRPFLGMEVVNLHEADFNFLAQLVTRFPNIFTAVVVTKVEGDSPACRSGIRTNDVIVKLEDKLVQSKLEFYETIWDKAGKAVEVNVLRVADGEELNVILVIEETSPNKFHKWPLPGWDRL